MKFILFAVFCILLIAKSQSVNPYFASCCAPDGSQCYDGTSSIDSNPSDPDFCDRACYRLECNYKEIQLNVKHVMMHVMQKEDKLINYYTKYRD